MIIEFPRWQDMPVSAWPGRHFQPRELACRMSGSIKFDLDFLAWLDNVRDALESEMGEEAARMAVSSGYRSPAHNHAITGKIDGAHVAGQAVDILCHGQRADRIDWIARSLGVRGRGWKQHGPVSGRYIHLDRWSRRAESTIWTYPK